MCDGQSSKVRDYSHLRLNGKEKATVFAKAFMTACAVAYLCYDSAYALILAVPLVPFLTASAVKKKKKKVKWELNMSFCEAIRAISGSLEGGYSFENAVNEAYKDMSLSHGPQEPIMEELRVINAKTANNISVEEAFRSLGKRSGIDDISGFADVFAIAKRTGGNSIEIIRSTAELIRTRVELTRDMRTAVASKKFEADIMKALPLCMLAYLRLFSPDLISALYGNLKGILFMSALLAVYLAMCVISSRITEIEL